MYELSPRFLGQSWQIEDGGRTGWLVAMQNACSIFLINEAWTEPSLHFSLQVSAQPVTGCAASRFFTAVFVKRDKRRHAAPSPACFEVWKGRGSSSQFLRCTGGVGFWRRGLGVSLVIHGGFLLAVSYKGSELGEGGRWKQSVPSLLKTEGSYSVPCGNSRF